MFKRYISLLPLGYHTKDSDFLFKDVFVDFRVYGSKDKNLITYLERVYSSFVYGYVILPDVLKTDIRSRTFFNFWFKDLFVSNVCEMGVGHIRCSEFVQSDTFYFLLACENKDILISHLQFLRSKYSITILDYSASPTNFVTEFMHYNAEVAYFNTYFIGIFNAFSWVLFVEVFQQIKETLNDNMHYAAYSLEVKNNLTVEEKQHARFAYFRYTTSYFFDLSEEYYLNLG